MPYSFAVIRWRLLFKCLLDYTFYIDKTWPTEQERERERERQTPESDGDGEGVVEKRACGSEQVELHSSFCGGVFCLSLKIAFGKRYLSVFHRPSFNALSTLSKWRSHTYPPTMYIFILRSIINFWNRSMSDNVIWQRQLLRPQNIYLNWAENLMHLHTWYIHFK